MSRLPLVLAFLLAAPAWAVEPDEMLSDPALEERARELSRGLRCPVCQNESIDESNAPLSSELRVILRERLVAGDSDAEAVDYIVDRYGEYVLLEPTLSGANWILWLSAPAVLLLGLGGAFAVIRSRAAAEQADALSEQERKRLEEILKG